jgi:hypothetical protein
MSGKMFYPPLPTIVGKEILISGRYCRNLSPCRGSYKAPLALVVIGTKRLKYGLEFNLENSLELIE